jgi:hypothetical protein
VCGVAEMKQWDEIFKEQVSVKKDEVVATLNRNRENS